MRRIKMFVIVAALALAAVATTGAAAASASGFFAGSYPAEFSGKTEGITLSVNGGIQCVGGPNFAGTISSPSESLTTSSMQGTKCGASGGSSLTTNGCQLTLRPGIPATGQGKFEIGPAGCGPIKIESPYCVTTIPAQTQLAASYANIGSGSSAGVGFTANVTNLKYTETGIGCANGNGSFSNGSLTGTWEIRAYDKYGSSTPLRVADNLPVGVFLNGGKVEAEKYPVNLYGTQNAPSEKVLGTNSGDITCKSAVFTGGLGEASTSFSLNPQLGECQISGLPATVKTNGCHLVIDVAAVNADIVCPKEGAKIEILTPFNSCNTNIPAQNNLEGVTLSNVGSGSNRGVAVQLSLKGVAYSQSGYACQKTGSFTNGTTSIGFTMLANH